MDSNLASEQVRHTASMIAVAPTTLILQRPTRIRTASGGVAPQGSVEPQPPITVMFGAKMQDGLPLQDNQGDRVIGFFTIVAMPGTDIQEGDFFQHNNHQYKVTRVTDHLDYEVKADVQTWYGGYR